MANNSSGSDTESLPDLDEFLASNFDPDISEKEVGDMGECWQLRVRHLRALSLRAIFVGYPRRGFGVRDSHNQNPALAAAEDTF